MKATAFEITGTDTITIRNTAGDTVKSGNISELLGFLRYKAGGTLRCFIDLDESIAPILHKLPPNIVQQLAEFNNDVYYLGNHLYYLPGRVFQVGKSRFYGLKEFYAILDFVPYTPLGEVQKMADDVIVALNTIGIDNPRKLTSPIACFEDSEWGQQVYDSIPKGFDIPQSYHEALDYAHQADGKDWVEARQVGYWRENEIWDYDMTACYTYLASQLPDLRNCEFWKSDGKSEKDTNAQYGFLRGKFQLFPESKWSHCSPIMAEIGGDLLGNPLGKLPDDVYSLDEIRFEEGNGIGEFQVKDGWFFNAPSNPQFPFRDIMENFYRMRNGSSVVSIIAKGLGNQLVGKMVETKVSGEYGQIRNDIYHALITTKARVAIAQFLIYNDVTPDEIVAIQTDGCRLTRYINLPSNGFGRWRCNGSQPTIVLSPRKVYCDDRKPYRIAYADVINMVSEHPLSERYDKMTKHRVTLREARESKNIMSVGNLVDRPAGFDLIALESEQNRVFEKLPKTGQALLSNKYMSEPIELN